MLRQGDVLLIPARPSGARVSVRHVAGVTLALGERTGHSHVLHAPDGGAVGVLEDPETGDLVALDVPPGAVLRHEEHRHLAVPVGLYRVQVQREYVPAERPTRRWD